MFILQFRLACLKGFTSPEKVFSLEKMTFCDPLVSTRYQTAGSARVVFGQHLIWNEQTGKQKPGWKIKCCMLHVSVQVLQKIRSVTIRSKG